ncbi:hypothetical protein J7E97_21360 [Streptomyces sp. ISL-66]|nr:hypothetical protein [Streptomyces sp. ISL-66]
MTCTGPVLPPLRARFEWSAGDQRAVDTVRVLAAGAVRKAGDGHPGTAMRLAPAAYTLFHKVMRHDPADADWTGRDRFVLSAGRYSSLTLHIQLYLAGFGLEPDCLEAFRTWASKTPAHPEHGHTTGVGTTSDPVGQGVAHAVGLAVAARYERGLFDPEAAPGTSPFDHYVYAVADDDCLQEGICAEASSMAGQQKLGNLILLWDDHHLWIEGDTDTDTDTDTGTAISEDTLERYEAYGWHVQRVRPKNDGDLDPAALYAAIEAAKADTERPSLIAMRSTIAWPAPKAQGAEAVHARSTEAGHGSALGDEEVAATERVPGFDPEQVFEVPDEVIAHTRGALHRGAQARTTWEKSFAAWRTANPERAAEFDRNRVGELPAGREEKLPVFETGPFGVGDMTKENF